MDKVYNTNGGYTSEAVSIANEVRNKMGDLIRAELEAGTPIEALEYIIYSEIHTEILKQSIGLRLGK